MNINRLCLTVLLLLFGLHIVQAQKEGFKNELNVKTLLNFTSFQNGSVIGFASNDGGDSLISRQHNPSYGLEIGLTRRFTKRLLYSVRLGFESFTFTEKIAAGYYEKKQSPLVIAEGYFIANSFSSAFDFQYELYSSKSMIFNLSLGPIIDYTRLQFYYKPLISIASNLVFEKRLSERLSLQLSGRMKEGIYTRNTLRRQVKPRTISCSFGITYKFSKV